MRVLMFGWEFPPHITGGLGTACYGMCRGLLAQGAEVIFTAPKLYGDEDKGVARMVSADQVEVDLRHPMYEYWWKNLTYIEIGAHLIPYVGLDDYFSLHDRMESGALSIGEFTAKRKFQFSGQYRQNLMEEVERYAMVASTVASQHQFDVIHAHDWLTYMAGIAAKQVSGKPLVIHVHATEFDRSGENVNTRVFDIERRGMMAADRIITVSNYTRDIVIHRYGIPAEKVHTVYNAVEPSAAETLVPVAEPITVSLRKLKPRKTTPTKGGKTAAAKAATAAASRKTPAKRKIVTFLGRVTYQKGPEYFVEAARLILQHDPSVHFVMAGSGDMFNRIVDRVAALRMGSHFHFAGFLKGPEVDQMFRMSDVYVMPSVSEPFGISPLEAMRSHVPVVISKQSGVSEILDHALKVDFWDVDALADAIYGLLHYPPLSAAFRRYGAQEVERLKWENAAKHLMHVYEMATGRA